MCFGVNWRFFKGGLTEKHWRHYFLSQLYQRKVREEGKQEKLSYNAQR